METLSTKENEIWLSLGSIFIMSRQPGTNPTGTKLGRQQKQGGRENVQGLGANQIGACIMDGPKSIRNMSEISEVSEVCGRVLCVRMSDGDRLHSALAFCTAGSSCCCNWIETSAVAGTIHIISVEMHNNTKSQMNQISLS